MDMTTEEIQDIPLIYPLVSVTFRTVAVVNGRRIDNECEIVLNMDQTAQSLVDLGKTYADFENYVSRVSDLVNSPQGQDELQSILDTSEQARLTNSTNPPSSPLAATDQDPDTAPLDQRADLPDSASL